MRMSLQKRDMTAYKAFFSKKYPEGKWSQETVGHNQWMVQRTEEENLRPRPPGGPFQSWLLAIGDTGYTMAFELGASKESLENPEVHVLTQQVFRHLIESVKIEPLNEHKPEKSTNREK
jgi:hypothetical protein